MGLDEAKKKFYRHFLNLNFSHQQSAPTVQRFSDADLAVWLSSKVKVQPTRQTQSPNAMLATERFPS